MRAYRIIIFILFGICLSFCARKQDPSPDNYRDELAKQIQSDFPLEIKTAYFQKWIAGKKQSGQGIHFYIEFKKPLSKELKLEKIYFHNQETKIVKITPTLYKASFFQKPFSKDLILDSDSIKEYGNEAPVMAKQKFDLKPNEALLEYKSNNTIEYFKLTHIKEREMILYPSRNIPMN